MNQPEGASHSIRTAIGNLFWRGFQTEWGIYVSDESIENLTKANDHLKQDPLAIFANHQSIFDSIWGAAFAASFLSDAEELMIPAVMKYMDPKRNPLIALALRMLFLVDIEPVPVVSHTDFENYSEEKRIELREKLKAKTAQMVTLQGGVYAIFPEGTRSEDGKLQPVIPGLGYLPSFDPDNHLAYLPVCIIYAGPSERRNEIRVGEMFTYAQIAPLIGELPEDPKERAQLIADHMVQNHLAPILPHSMRGVSSYD